MMRHSLLQLGDVQAGAIVEDIGFACYDEAGRPTPAGGAMFAGRVMCGWMRKARKAVLSEAGAIVLLPALDVPKEVRLPLHSALLGLFVGVN